jgi:pimeloyl-ACP methyl ester carboxylesterase
LWFISGISMRRLPCGVSKKSSLCIERCRRGDPRQAGYWRTHVAKCGSESSMNALGIARAAGLACIVSVAVGLSGCSLFFPAPTPLRATSYPAQRGTQSSSLLVLLPGRGDSAAEFEKHGITNMVRQLPAPVDVIAVDAGLGYYMRGTLRARLSEDVIGPALTRGYRSIWVGGISMGGLGALWYAEQRPSDVAGVLVVAPFLGDKDVIDEIEHAGGVAMWTPAKPIEPDDYQRRIWLWLQGCARRPDTCPRIYLGFGRSDRFARAHRLLAAVLPADHVMQVEGDHDWPPWQTLFAQALPRIFPGR